jgi:hypothetical protein
MGICTKIQITAVIPGSWRWWCANGPGKFSVVWQGQGSAVWPCFWWCGHCGFQATRRTHHRHGPNLGHRRACIGRYPDSELEQKNSRRIRASRTSCKLQKLQKKEAESRKKKQRAELRQLLLENFFELATQWRLPDEVKRKRFLDVALAPPSRSSDCRGMNPNGQPPPGSSSRPQIFAANPRNTERQLIRNV